MPNHTADRYVRWPWNAALDQGPRWSRRPAVPGGPGSTFSAEMSDNDGMSACSPASKAEAAPAAEHTEGSTPAELARRNWESARTALQETQQGELADRLMRVQLPPAQWVYGRDGSLTPRLAEGWLAGTGLPEAAAEQVMAGADATKPALCLVAPTHGQQVREMLDRIGPTQTIIALWADVTSAAWALRCVDFSNAIRQGRLWIVAADEAASAAEALEELFEQEPGLVVPTTLFRPGDADTPDAEQLLSTARAALGRAHAIRDSRIQEAARPIRVSVAEPRHLVLVPRQFQLWADAPHHLWSTLESQGLDLVPYDTDHPRNASLLSLACAVQRVTGVFAADTLRTDFGIHLPEDRPWITWVTRPREAVPFGGGKDAIVLAEAAWAGDWLAKGWPTDRVAIGEWRHRPTGDAITTEPVLIHDLPDLEPPASVERYSTQRILWEHLAEDLVRIPFLLHEQESPQHLVRRRAEVMGVVDVPTGLFVSGCVIPAYLRGIGRMLCRAGVHVRLFGTGWESDPVTSPRSHGPVTSREQFEGICEEAPVVVYALPQVLPATAAAGRRLLMTSQHTEANFLAAVRRAIQHPAMVHEVELPLTAPKLMELARRVGEGASAAAGAGAGAGAGVDYAA